MELFAPSPVPGIVQLSDVGVDSFLAELDRQGTSPITQNQRALVVLMLTAAVFPASRAVDMAQAMLILLTEGYDSLIGHLMLESMNVSSN